MQRYGWLCVLGGEVAYWICLLGGYLPLRSVRGTEIHHALFETLPGFTWGSPWSMILGAVYVFAVAWIFGAYRSGYTIRAYLRKANPRSRTDA
jgi:hypothetical protein